MGRTYIRKREIQVSYDHTKPSADFYCVPDRIRGVYNENGFLHFAISEEQTFEGFSLISAAKRRPNPEDADLAFRKQTAAFLRQNAGERG